MADFGSWPEDVRTKITAHMMEGNYKETRLELHNKFFADADKNADGMLDKDEFRAYQEMWHAHMKSKFGDNVPFNEEIAAEAFDINRVSGKDGITQEDF
eukprot:CAMPEP_0116876032 /NCGR_PEP_ID=MMETSP0463-20121206/8093_1 /TAXON_ID=181622 /ORGANISM="Strombidinopsis sp, Strain SopsisLIS2011" /LENGTH=98 /DNA_ID=CAMNT_0004522469 /DNA_START=80 /DNA_END=376 /DNA_ORIENTATION=-